MDVTGLAHHILSLEPAKDAARLCFYHYLKNFWEANTPLTRELLNAFYSRALSFTHWQENKAKLFGEVQACLTSYATRHPEDSAETMADLDKAWRINDIQAVPIEAQSNLVAFITRFYDERLQSLEQFRVFPEGKDRAVAILMTADRELKVTVFGPTLKMIAGELSPICMDYTLHYGPDLMLAPNKLQQVDVGGHTVAHFRLGPDGCKGALIRGYTFQRYAAIDGGNLHRHPILFYPVKRLEQFFINRKTDPMYVELTGIIEKAVELLTQGHPEGVKFGRQALERGQFALEQLFPDDKLVRLLINNLEKTLALEAARQERGLPFPEDLTAVGSRWSPRVSIKAATPLGSDEVPGELSEPTWEKNRPLNV